MKKNRHCPQFRVCAGECSNCTFSKAFNSLHKKIQRLQKKIIKLEETNKSKSEVKAYEE